MALLGGVQLENFQGLTKMPQEAASSWASLDALTGARYVPILYVGKQIVNGTNYIFIAEYSPVTLNPTRRLVKIVINRNLLGEYSLVKPVEIIA